MLMNEYAGHISRTVETICREETGKILQAAQMVKKVMAQDGLIYIFGCGHSHMLAEEGFYRAGGLACVAPIFYPPLMLHEGGTESSRLEREVGLAAKILEKYPITRKDMVFCLSTSGVNPVCVEMAEILRSQGVPTAAICSAAYFDQPARTVSGKHLYEAVDLWIDNKAPHGDACLQPQGAMARITPLSTIAGAFILNSILAEATELALADGVDVPIYVSGNIPGGAARNKELIARYKPRIPHL